MRTKSLQVLSLGMPRTGTASMKLALETLGFGPVMHAYEIVDYPEKAEAWIPLIRAKWEGKGGPVTRQMMDAAIGEYTALTDAPCVAFWEELIELYPEAKVILVQRDFDPWLKSFDLVIDNIMGLPGIFTRYVLEPLTGGQVLFMFQRQYQYQFGGLTSAEIRKNTKQVYTEHYDNIRRKVPKQRLLDYKLGEGWEPLCRFLQKQVPEGEFPRINDAADFKRKVNEKMKSLAWQTANAAVMPMLALLGAAVCYFLFLNEVNTMRREEGEKN